MKHLILALLLIFTSTCDMMAQRKEQMEMGGPGEGPGGPGQKIKAIYIAYMTQELQLTEEEAQRFWPIHAEFHQEMKSKHRQPGDELEKEESLLNIKKKYKARFVKSIGEDRANLFFKKDAEFRHKIAERIKDGRNGRKGFRQ